MAQEPRRERVPGSADARGSGRALRESRTTETNGAVRLRVSGELRKRASTWTQQSATLRKFKHVYVREAPGVALSAGHDDKDTVDPPRRPSRRPKFLLGQVTLGLIRDRSQRRGVMFFLVLGALFQIFVGSIFLEGFLSERPLLFLAYWFVCFWLTLSAMLLALYDLLQVRASSRYELRRMRKTMLPELDSQTGEKSAAGRREEKPGGQDRRGGDGT